MLAAAVHTASDAVAPEPLRHAQATIATEVAATDAPRATIAVATVAALPAGTAHGEALRNFEVLSVPLGDEGWEGHAEQVDEEAHPRGHHFDPRRRPGLAKIGEVGLVRRVPSGQTHHHEKGGKREHDVEERIAVREAEFFVSEQNLPSDVFLSDVSVIGIWILLGPNRAVGELQILAVVRVAGSNAGINDGAEHNEDTHIRNDGINPHHLIVSWATKVRLIERILHEKSRPLSCTCTQRCIYLLNTFIK